MANQPYIKIFAPEEERDYSSFYIYMPAGEQYYAQYRFVYVKNPVNESIVFENGPNDPANCDFFRVREAYIGKLDGEVFTPAFRALQGGEIGFAFCEKGAGDYSGGFHGDELIFDVSLNIDGIPTPLNQEYFGSFEMLIFEESSYIYRCNTPSEKLVLHKQKYIVSGDTIALEQYIEWVADAKPLVAAFMPMLTVQRLDPNDTKRILTDTVDFFSEPHGELLKTFDTTPYGDYADGKFSENHCQNTPSTAVKVYGKHSGFMVEGGYRVIDESIPKEQISTMLCIRYGKSLDNKIYFNIAAGTAPQSGTVWKSDIYYRLTYLPKKS